MPVTCSGITVLARFGCGRLSCSHQPSLPLSGKVARSEAEWRMSSFYPKLTFFSFLKFKRTFWQESSFFVWSECAECLWISEFDSLGFKVKTGRTLQIWCPCPWQGFGFAEKSKLPFPNMPVTCSGITLPTCLEAENCYVRTNQALSRREPFAKNHRENGFLKFVRMINQAKGSIGIHPTLI